jgi:hypothetical protein
MPAASAQSSASAIRADGLAGTVPRRGRGGVLTSAVENIRRLSPESWARRHDRRLRALRGRQGLTAMRPEAIGVSINRVPVRSKNWSTASRAPRQYP